MLVLPQNSTTLNSLGVPIGGVLCPLRIVDESLQEDQDGEELVADQNWVCKCGLYYCASSIVKNDKVYCHMCRTSRATTQQVHPRLLKKGVVDMVMKHEPAPIYYVVLFEVSKAIVDSGLLTTAFEAIKSAAASLVDSTVMLVFVGHTSTEFRVYSFDPNSKELSANVSREFDEFRDDLTNVGCPASSCEEYLDALIEHIDTMNYHFIEPRFDRLPDVLALLIQHQPSLLKKVIVVSTKGQHANVYATGTAVPEHSSLQFQSADNKFKDLGNLMNDSGNNTTMDLFCIVQKGTVLVEDLKRPFLLSGGSVHFYEAEDCASEFYYDVYRCITRLTVFKVQLKCHAGVGIKVGSLVYGHYLKHRSKVDLNSFNEDSTISVLLQLCEYDLPNERKQFRHFRTSLQFSISYFDGKAHRRRIINYCMYRCNTNENHQVMAGFDPEAAARLLLAQITVYKHHTKNIALARQRLVDAVTRLREFYLTVKYNVETVQTNSKVVDLSLRYEESMGLFACHTFSLLHRYRGLALEAHGVPAWRIGLEEFQMLTRPIVETSKMLYPRVYELSLEDLEEANFNMMGATIYSDLNDLEEESLVVVDNGRRLFVYPNIKDTSMLERLFGTSNYVQIQKLTHLEPTQKLSTTLCSFLQGLRMDVRNGCLALQFIMSVPKLNKHEEWLFIENSYRSSGEDDFARFMRTYTQQ